MQECGLDADPGSSALRDGGIYGALLLRRRATFDRYHRFQPTPNSANLQDCGVIRYPYFSMVQTVRVLTEQAQFSI